MVEGGEAGGQGGGQEGKGGWDEEGGEEWSEEQEGNLREGGDDSTDLVFLVLFFIIPFLARENDSVRAMTWQGRNCENWLIPGTSRWQMTERPKTMITSARDDCYAFFVMRTVTFNIQYHDA